MDAESGEQPGGGWRQQNIQLPDETWRVFKAEAAQRGHASVRTLGTIAMNLLLGMPPRVREALFSWAMLRMRYGDPDRVTIEETWRIFEEAMARSDAEPDEELLNWIVTRILDPEITPPPGQKASDRKKKGA